MACYVSLPLLTFLMLIWCAWNQRWAPVSGSTVPLERAKFGDDTSGHGRSYHGALRRQSYVDMSTVDGQLTQTGYRTTFIGLVLYYLIVLAHVIIQFLLFALTVEYCECSKTRLPFLLSRLYAKSLCVLLVLQTFNKGPSPGPFLVPKSFSTMCRYCWHSK